MVAGAPSVEGTYLLPSPKFQAEGEAGCLSCDWPDRGTFRGMRIVGTLGASFQAPLAFPFGVPPALRETGTRPSDRRA